MGTDWLGGEPVALLVGLMAFAAFAASFFLLVSRRAS
jgi:hypothetical protein